MFAHLVRHTGAKLMDIQDPKDLIDFFIGSTAELDGDDAVDGADFLDKVRGLRDQMRKFLQHQRGWIGENHIDLHVSVSTSDGEQRESMVGEPGESAWPDTTETDAHTVAVDLTLMVNGAESRTVYLSGDDWRDLEQTTTADPLLQILAYARNGHTLEAALQQVRDFHSISQA
jgi:hypothetical protein